MGIHVLRVFLLAFLFITFACASLDRSEVESQKINEFFEEAFEQGVSLSPMWQTMLGRKTNYDQLNDLSEAQSLKRHQINKNQLETLRSFNFDFLPHSDQVSYLLFEERLNQSIESFEFRYHSYGISHRRGVHTWFPSFMMTMHRVDDVDDAKAYISRLMDFKEQFPHVITRLEKSREKGIVPPAFVYDQAIESSQNIISGAPFDKSNQVSPLLKDFTRKVEALEIEDGLRQELMAQATMALLASVEPAYLMLIEKLEELSKEAPIEGATYHLPRGDEFYQMRLRHMTTTDMTAEEVHQLGLRETERIHQEMKEVIKEIGFEGSLSDFFDYVKTSPELRYPDTQEGKDQYIADTQAIIERMEEFLPEIFGILPKAPLEVRPVEPFRERSAGLAFYQGPSEDGSRPGIYYINLYDMASVDKYTQEALAYHEAVPGHHMQIAIATELEDIPQFRKYGRYTVYSEGWGLYAEYIPYEYGFYEDPLSNFGRLAMELHRTGRLVVDTGLHHLGWTMEETIDWLDKYGTKTHEENVRSVQRYVVMPAQATTYFIGMNKIIELKEMAEKKLGDSFDIRGFHDEVLKDGAVPLWLLEEKVERWIEREMNKNREEV